VHALALEACLEVLVLELDALISVAVALAPASDGYVTDGVEVRPEDFRVAENIVTERVQAVQAQSDVGSSDPVAHLLAGLKVVGARPVLECAEGH